MTSFYRQQFVILLAIVATVIEAQSPCEDFSADKDSCTKFFRCFYNLRIKFTCPPGTAWEDTLKTCVWQEYVEACTTNARAQARLIENDEAMDAVTFEADVDALNDIPVGQTLAEARALGPIVTPKQYQCSYCGVGACAVVVNVIQCICGNNQCPPATTAPPRNLCNPNPCLNGGQCISQGLGFICQCPVQFTGNRCEAPAATPCQPNPCLNGGVCSVQGTTFFCHCPATFTGRCCEIRVTTTPPNPCAGSPCQNGGQCIPNGATFLCQCPAGYYGTRCELRNYCTPNPCANNGLCTQTSTGYICSCAFPYTGTNCQQIIATTPPTTRAPPTCPACACVFVPCPTVVVTNPCLPNPCQNQGGCAVQNNAARCFCPDAYYGYYCQVARNSRSLTSKACNKTCLNGGQCYIDETRGGQARCSCPNEFAGSQCELANRPKSCSPKNPCMNNAKCINTKAGAQCACSKGTSGVLCERIQRSAGAKYCPLECQAGGTCVYVKSTPKCRCPKGRTGQLCESRTGKSLSSTEFDEQFFPIVDENETETL